MAISTLAQTLGVTGVERIIVTDIETDGDIGDKVREIRILRTLNGDDEVPVLIIRVSGETAAAIEITAPE